MNKRELNTEVRIAKEVGLNVTGIIPQHFRLSNGRQYTSYGMVVDDPPIQLWIAGSVKELVAERSRKAALDNRGGE